MDEIVYVYGLEFAVDMFIAINISRSIALITE